MMSNLYTDRKDGPRPRTGSKIGAEAWRAFAALIQSQLNRFAFGHKFPRTCPDGGAHYGCDEDAFFAAFKGGVVAFPELQSEFRGAGWNEPDESPTDAILDGVEWCASKVGEPQQVGYHESFKHDHLHWNHSQGLQTWVTEVNQIFSRQGLAYEMDDNGKIRRVVEGPAPKILARALFNTGDTGTDQLLEQARRRFFDRDADAGQDAIEALWDAFERLKTHHGDKKETKKESVVRLLKRAAQEYEPLCRLLDEEMKTLTKIGNEWQIRHHETDKHSLGVDRNLRDYLFLRMFSIVWLLLARTGCLAATS